MGKGSGFGDSVRKAARLFRIKKVTPADMVAMAIKSMEDSRMQLGRDIPPVVPDEYLLTLAGDTYDEMIGMIEPISRQIEDQLRAYALDAGFRINKNRIAVHLARMPSTRRGYARAEALFSRDTDLNQLQPTMPLDEIRMRFDGDERTMIFGRLSRQNTWKDNYTLRNEADFNSLAEAVRMMDAGLTADADKIVTQLLKDNPSHNGLWILHDHLNYIDGDLTSVEKLKTRALLVKDDPLLGSALALMLLQDGDSEAAMWEVLEALNRDPENPLAVLLLAHVYQNMDLPELAAQIVDLIPQEDRNETLIDDLVKRFRPQIPKSAPVSEKPTRFYRLKHVLPGSIRQAEAPVLVETRKAKLFIGRVGSPSEPDVMLDDDMVSKMHCQIINSGGIFYIIDCDSRNGIFVNGNRVETMPLKSGDMIRIGSTILKFETDDNPMKE